MTTDINDAVKLIRDAWDVIKNEFFKSNPGKYLILTCVYRSPSEQLELFKKGRDLTPEGKWTIRDKSQIVTNVDGITVLSAHNYMPSRAIDVAVVDNQSGKTLWEEVHYFSLVEICKGVTLESGGSWKPFKDYPHIQVPDFKEYKGS